MLSRRISSVLHQRLEFYPAVALIGPRQSGKTTLARSLPSRYYDLEQDRDRLRLDLDWPQVIKGEELVVIDEAQSWPSVFPMLRGAIDAERGRYGRFLLLGSVSPALMREVSESLAGRLALVELSPFSLLELPHPRDLQRLWLIGGYADGGILDPRMYPNWQLDYLRLLTERDLPNLGLPASPMVTNRLLRMLAALHGREWNASQVGKSLGLSYHTVNRYVDYLEGVFLVRRLPAWHGNIRKRLVKRAKLYWRDTGLLHALLGVPTSDALHAQPWVGLSWEGFVVEQILVTLDQANLNWQAYHLRTSDQREIDLVLEVDGERWALEMKLTAKPTPQDLASLNAKADLIAAKRRFLVCRHSDALEGEAGAVCDLPWMLEFIQAN